MGRRMTSTASRDEGLQRLLESRGEITLVELGRMMGIARKDLEQYLARTRLAIYQTDKRPIRIGLLT